MAGESRVARESLIGLFWPDSAPKSARHSLTNLLYEARRVLTKDAIEGRGDTVRLNPERWDIDLWRFREAIGQQDGATAVEEYRGGFLEGIRVHAPTLKRWIEEARQRQSEDFVCALEREGREAAAREDFRAAAGFWQRAVDENPLHATNTCELMLALARSGDPAAAVLRAARHSELRATELDLPPDPAVSLLEDRIKRGDWELTGAATPEPAIPVLTRSGPPDVLRPPLAVSGEVQEEFQKALLLISMVTTDGFENAVRILERVVKAAPEFVPGHLTLAYALVATVLDVATRDPAEALARAMVATRRALDLAPKSAEAHATLAWVTLFGEWDLIGARRLAYRGTALGLVEPDAILHTALTLSVSGDPAAARTLVEEAVSRDPFGYLAEVSRGMVMRHSGVESSGFFREVVRQRPEAFWGRLLLALSVPEDPATVREFTASVIEDPDSPAFPLSLAAAALGLAGDGSHVDRVLRVCDSEAVPGRRLFAERALALSGAGRRAEAKDAFALAVRYREPNALLMWMDPLLRPLLDRPLYELGAAGSGVAAEAPARTVADPTTGA